MLPDLLIVDGGKGQLSRAVAVLEKFNLLDQVPVVGLAKQNEELFVPDQVRSIILPNGSQGLFLVQRVRDEAHRFAIGTHRNRRSKQIGQSPLDEIPGIGPRRKKALLLKFGSAKQIARAGLADLEKVDGISHQMAQQIYDFFNAGS